MKSKITIVICVLVFIALGYSIFATKFFAEKKDEKEAGKVLLEVPFVRQKEWFCSEASASMVLQYYGYNLTQDEIHRMGYDRFEIMLPLFQRYLNAELRRSAIDELKKEILEGDPIIIRILLGYYRHTIVVTGFDPDFIYVHDPAIGPYVPVRPEELLEVWEPTGFLAIIFE